MQPSSTTADESSTMISCAVVESSSTSVDSSVVAQPNLQKAAPQHVSSVVAADSSNERHSVGEFEF